MYLNMGLCNLLAFICCPRRYHRINVLSKVDVEEVKIMVDEFEEVYKEKSRLVDVEIE